MDKALDNADTADAVKTTPGIKIQGDPDIWRLECKASGKNWMKSTKKMLIYKRRNWLQRLFDLTPAVIGHHLQVSTEFRDDSGKVTTCAEAVTTCMY
jgi:hypothetical protein